MKVMTSYGFAKAIGTLYFQNAAAENPKMRIVAASPGSTHSTSAANGTPTIMQYFGMHTQMWLMSFFGMSHAPPVAAQRYMDVLLTPDNLKDKAPSGTFLAGSGTFGGHLVDQAPWYPQLWTNKKLQQAAGFPTLESQRSRFQAWEIQQLLCHPMTFHSRHLDSPGIH